MLVTNILVTNVENMMPRRRWWMLAVTCLAVVVVSVDMTVLNIALPAISAALRAGTADLQWLNDAYSLAYAAVILIAGALGDRFGRKRLLLGGLTLFLGASLWCALSVSVGELIAARALMGLGGGTVFPLALAVVPVAFTSEERPKAIGILTAGVALGLPLGPVMGGLLLQHFSWHSVFWLNVPVATLAIAAGIVLMPESRNPEWRPLDICGALLPTAAVICLVWGLINGPEHGWTSPATWGFIAGPAVLLPAFVLRERRGPKRFVDPALFRDHRFSWGTAATVAVSVALFGILFFFPQYLQSVAGDDPIGSGLRLLPMMGGLLVAGLAAEQVVRAVGTKLTVAAGLALLVAGLAILADVHVATGYPFVAAGLALSGLGTGGSISPAMSAVMEAVGGDEAGTGASLNSALRQVGAAVAIAVLGSVLSSAYTSGLRPALRALPLKEAAVAKGSVAEAVQLAAHLPSGGGALRAAAAAAFLHGMSTVMLICAGVVAVAVFTSLRYLPGRSAAHAARAGSSPSNAGPTTGARR